jgi:hypothetical protein
MLGRPGIGDLLGIALYGGGLFKNHPDGCQDRPDECRLSHQRATFGTLTCSSGNCLSTFRTRAQRV